MGLLTVWIAALLCGCANAAQAGTGGAPEALAKDTGVIAMENTYTADTRITDVISDPVFGDYGRLIFPVNGSYYSGDTLGDLRLTWYNNIDPDKTVEIAKYMKAHAAAGDTIFYDIYTDEEKAADPAKEDTGLFFFKGNPGERFAICNAGGGFAYVGAMHDSFHSQFIYCVRQSSLTRNILSIFKLFIGQVIGLLRIRSELAIFVRVV